MVTADRPLSTLSLLNVQGRRALITSNFLHLYWYSRYSFQTCQITDEVCRASWQMLTSKYCDKSLISKFIVLCLCLVHPHHLAVPQGKFLSQRFLYLFSRSSSKTDCGSTSFAYSQLLVVSPPSVIPRVYDHDSQELSIIPQLSMDNENTTKLINHKQKFVP